MPNGEMGPEMGGPPQPPTPEQKGAFGVERPELPAIYSEPLWTEIIRSPETSPEEIRWVVRKALSEMEEGKEFCDYYAIQAIVGGLKNRRYRLDRKELFVKEGLSNNDRQMRDELERLEKEVEARQRIQNAHALERKYGGDVGGYADMFLQPGKINFEAVDMKIIGRAPKTGVGQTLSPEKQEEEFGVMLDKAMRGYVVLVLAGTAKNIEDLASRTKKRGDERVEKSQSELEIDRRKLEFIRRILRDNFGSENVEEIIKSSATKIRFVDPQKKEESFGEREVKLQEAFDEAKKKGMPNIFTESPQDEGCNRTREFIVQNFKASRETAILAFNLFRVFNLATVFDTDIGGMPASNDFIKMAHLEYKRAKEYARFKALEVPYPAGPPSTLGKYPDLITDFLHFAGVKKEGGKSLWQLWWHEGIGFGFLPWEERNGVGKEDFDYYRYVCWRAKNVYEDLTKETDLPDFIKEGGFEKRNKNFDTALRDREGETGKAEYKNLEGNPRVQYVIGMIYEHHPNGYRTPEDADRKRETIPVVQRWNFLTADQLGKLRDSREAAEAVSKSVILFLTLAESSGFITQKERTFIEKYCKISPSFLGLRW